MPEAAQLDSDQFEGAFALLAELTQHFAEALNLERTLERALESIAAHVGAEAGSLWLVENDGQELACAACVGPNPITGLRLPVSEGIVGKSVRENACQTVLDVASDPDFSQKMDAESGFLTRSLLCAPMRFSEDVIGAVELVNKRDGDGRFATRDGHLLQVLASSAGLAIANARLAADQLENERVRRELELAAEIQRNLLPAPRPAPFPIYGLNVPARTVSGDFFDILPVSRRRFHFCLGDVSGKGMNAAMLMAKTASLYRCLAREAGSPGVLLARLNDEICETATRGMFVTMAAGIYDANTGAVRLANAGHEPPLFRARDGSFADFPAQAPPLGIVAGSAFPEDDLELAGGALYLCSDGLTEAEAGPGNALGADGLRRLVTQYREQSLAERIEAIGADVSAMDTRDDLTLLGVSDEAER
ncbi:MAG: GAF domain-containing SpoIIE family protein phosphatase [Myxococcota bacterium]|nr:GAF domain-containing SpoIIE family protein phosphatase [Myxococcota bacterium]